MPGHMFNKNFAASENTLSIAHSIANVLVLDSSVGTCAFTFFILLGTKIADAHLFCSARGCLHVDAREVKIT